MKQLFAVLRTRGAEWDASRPLEEQREWGAHAEFMDRLETEGFVALGGPLAGTPDALLIVRAADEAEVRSRLAADPWSGMDLLKLVRVERWTLRLGTLDGRRTDPEGTRR